MREPRLHQAFRNGVDADDLVGNRRVRPPSPAAVPARIRVLPSVMAPPSAGIEVGRFHLHADDVGAEAGDDGVGAEPPFDVVGVGRAGDRVGAVVAGQDQRIADQRDVEAQRRGPARIAVGGLDADLLDAGDGVAEDDVRPGVVEAKRMSFPPPPAMRSPVMWAPARTMKTSSRLVPASVFASALPVTVRAPPGPAKRRGG